MRKSGTSGSRVILAALAAGVLAASAISAAMLVTSSAALAGSASSGTCSSSADKCFAVVVAPTSIASGANASFAFTITNEAPTQQLGSVQLTAPSGLVIVSSPGSASFSSTSALFLNLSLAPGETTTLTVSATALCGSGSSYQWAMLAKQSNDFNGPPGNDFQMESASSSNLSGTINGTCSLAFAGQPAGTAAGAVISTAFDSHGGPVTVDILDGNGQLASSSAAAVTVSIAANPGSGSLSGTNQVNARGGIASFGNLSINRAGIGYALSASSPGIAPATSALVTIWGSISGCSAAPCSASSSTGTTAGSVTTSSAPTGDFLGAGLGGVSYSCNSTYQPVSDPLSFDVLSGSGLAQSNAEFSGTLEIFKSAVQASGHPGASSWQICYASTTPFTAASGTAGTAAIGGIAYYTGLLPDCSSSQGAPCVQARNKDNAGDVVITFLASGDPVGRA